jgi:hypothetical protein
MPARRTAVVLTAAVLTAALSVPTAEAAVPAITFVPAVFYPTGQAFDSPSVDENGTALADLNGDGNLDVVAVDQAWGNTIDIQYGNGHGAFSSPGTVITVGNGVPGLENVVTGKFTSSGRSDIVVLSLYGFYMLRNDGGGHFTQSGLTQLQQAPFQDSAVAGDFNNDGKLDLEIKTVSGIQAELGTGNATFTAGPLTTIPGSLPPGISGIVTAKVNGDTVLDLFAADAGSQQVFSLAGTGTGGFAVAGSAITPLVPGGVVAIKDTPNGLDSVVVLREFNTPGTSPALFVNTGSGGLGSAKQYDGGYNPIGDTSGDFNADGNGDVVSSDTTGSRLVVLAGDGSGGLVQAGSFPAGLFQQTPSAGDVNADGTPDVVVTTLCPSGFWYGQTCLAVLINQS